LPFSRQRHSGLFCASPQMRAGLLRSRPNGRARGFRTSGRDIV